MFHLNIIKHDGTVSKSSNSSKSMYFFFNFVFKGISSTPRCYNLTLFGLLLKRYLSQASLNEKTDSQKSNMIFKVEAFVK